MLVSGMKCVLSNQYAVEEPIDDQASLVICSTGKIEVIY